MCKHLDFKARVEVARMEDSGRFMASVWIDCAQCGQAMQFMGLKPGINFGGAAVDLGGTEARLAIAPTGTVETPFQQMTGVQLNS